jgi:hypothetical protein
MDFQFYPTPKELGRKLWAKFKNREFLRVLEPSAGNGDLAQVAPWDSERYKASCPIDCCEIDISKHTRLREQGFNVVGTDFMEFGSGAIYSHVIANPPFLNGAEHVLKAWDLLWDGEVAAIINADTLRNPFSAQRRQLLRLIHRYGEIEFIENAFMVEEAERKTPVDIGLVYLCKKADAETEIFGTLLNDLAADQKTAKSLSGDYQEAQEVMLPNNFIENSVLAFDAAVLAMRHAVVALAKANHYEAHLGRTMAELNGGAKEMPQDTSVKFVQGEIAARYEKLKDKAWTSVLRSSKITSRLSSSAQRRVESDFKAITKLEFTTKNIYGFLCGIVDNAGAIQVGMMLDVFDTISRYHDENTFFYRGWKSNGRHRTCGMRLKTTRFILPGFKVSSFRGSLDWDSERLLADFDKVFSMIDGRSEPEVSLVSVFDTHFTDLARSGKRVSSSYFDVRLFPGIGTVHFYPRSKELMDRLNRLVGKERAWLPPDVNQAGPGFWTQYDKAEKFDAELRKEVLATGIRSHYRNHFATLFYSGADSKEAQRAQEAIDAAAARVQERHGIDIDAMIEVTPSKTLLLDATNVGLFEQAA